MLDVYVRPYYFCRELMPHMQEGIRPHRQHLRPAPLAIQAGELCRVKAGLIGLTKTVAKEGRSQERYRQLRRAGAVDAEMFDAVLGTPRRRLSRTSP